MRIVYSLILLTIILGDGLVAFLVAMKLFWSWRLSRTFIYLALLFLAIAAHLVLLLIAINRIPQPRPEGFRGYLIAALVVLGLGVWPAAIHLLRIAGKD